jgi:outer membrane protein
MSSLDAVLGLDHEITYRLVDNSDFVAGPPIAFDPLIQKALAQRPDLQSVALQTKSAQRFARAQWDQTSGVDHGRRNRRDRSGLLGLSLH